MATLDISEDGPSIQRSIKSVQSSSPAKTASPTSASWVLVYVQAPLRNAFSQGPPKPSILKVQSTGEGDLTELFEDFNDGRIQFSFAKVKDPNTGLGKGVFIAWCGEGVPDHVKGNYSSYLTAVGRLFEGYHVQINARSQDDLNAESLVQKVSDASGSKYSAGSTASKPAPAVGTKPAWKPGQAYTPTRSSGTHNPAAPRGRAQGSQPVGKVDSDGWGEDAPQVSRSQLEKVGSAYQPTKVNMKELMSQPSSTTSGGTFDRPDPVKGAYEPTGKVDIAAIRAQGDKKYDSKPEIVKGAYQPVGKVDIGAIKAAARDKPAAARPAAPPRGETDEEPRSLADRSSAFQQPTASSGRLTSMPKPKPAKAFNTSQFSGTKPPTPGDFGTPVSSAQVGSASRDFGSSGGKTPSQLWQEKKNRERGISGGDEIAPREPPVKAATYDDEPQQDEGPGVSALRDRFKGMPPPSAASAPPVDMSTRPSAYETQARDRSPSPERSASPIRIAMPVARGAPRSPSPEREPSPEPAINRRQMPSSEPAPQRQATAAGGSGGGASGPFATILYDYEKAEDNEIELVEGETVSAIDFVDDDWWSGTNERGETGLFPSNYVELNEGDGDAGELQEAPTTSMAAPHHEQEQEHEPAPEAQGGGGGGGSAGHTATAVYDYEAAEDNELSFPEGATVTDVEFPDDDWWFGHYDGKTGLFPANYVELDQ